MDSFYHNYANANICQEIETIFTYMFIGWFGYFSIIVASVLWCITFIHFANVCVCFFFRSNYFLYTLLGFLALICCKDPMWFGTHWVCFDALFCYSITFFFLQLRTRTRNVLIFSSDISIALFFNWVCIFHVAVSNLAKKVFALFN